MTKTKAFKSGASAGISMFGRPALPTWRKAIEMARAHRAGVSAAVLALALAFGLSKPALAGESVISATPAGGNDLGAALLPPPGLYGGVAFVPANGWGFHDVNGKRVRSIDARLEVYTAAFAVQYVYPFEIFGGRVASLVQGSFNWADVRLRPMFDQKDTGVAIFMSMYSTGRAILAIRAQKKGAAAILGLECRSA